MSDRPDPHAPARVVLCCAALDEAVGFFEAHGLRLDAVFPADDPRSVNMSGWGLALELRRDDAGAAACTPPCTLVLPLEARPAKAPKPIAGMHVEFEGPSGLQLPDAAPQFELSLPEDEAWIVGRAGMRYRDLLPQRQGGRFIASLVEIADAGPVPDYVHFHEVRWQTIYCAHGWVRVVYEDQGEPFVLRAGDCVIQPPQIRHRVLESSQGLQVVELGCPAQHVTRRDHALTLPNGRGDPQREFDGQRFVRHVAGDAPWVSSSIAGFEARDIGIAAATHGLADQRVLRRAPGADTSAQLPPAGEFAFVYVPKGQAQLLRAQAQASDLTTTGLTRGAAFAWGPADVLSLREMSPDLELLWARLPG